MRLKRLELYGFKSFASRTEFDFGDGIVAIVGPNGSGKSNIADAIRWVMGEQSFSTLRAKSSEDMIFAGAGNRPRMGMAEVLITLDNTENLLPLDYSEVVVGRRAYRSGENEYLLNGSQVRYRDVLDILGGAGLARSQYTVIGQGMVDAALSLRPEARRALFEEAAGVAPHLRKRGEALRRIAETERNLERVRDILQELAPRARTLRRQAERAEEHQLLSRDLQELQRVWYGHQWQRRQRALAQAEQDVRRWSAMVEAQREQSQVLAHRLDQLLERRRAHADQLEALNSRLEALRDDAQRCERELAVAAERLRSYEQQRASISSDIKGLRSRHEVLTHEIARVRDELAGHERAHRIAAAALDDARSRLDQVDTSRHEVERRISDVEERLKRLAAVAANCSARLEQLDERREQLAHQRQASEETAEELSRRTADLERARQEAEANVAALERALEERLSAKADTDAELARARDALEDLRREVSRLERQRDDLASRRELLTRLRQEMTGYHPGVRAVLARGANLKGLLGTVVNLMRVPKGMEQAIESALGARLQNVITETWEDAAAAIAYLKQGGRGWATFLPLDTVRPRPPLRAPRGSGVVGVASDLVEYDERLAPVYRLLLGQVLVVDNLDTARRMLSESVRPSLIVTLEGETVQPTGAVSGGTRQRSSNLVAQEREWQALPRRIADAQRALDEAQYNEKFHAAALDELDRQAREAERSAAELRTRLEDGRRAASAAVGDLREAQREHSWHTARLSQADEELARLQQRRQILAEELRQVESQQQEAAAEIRSLWERLRDADDEALRREVGELETRVAVSRRAAESQRALLDSHISNLRQIDNQIAEKERQDDELASALAELSAQTDRERQRAACLEQLREDLLGQLEPAREEMARLQQQRQELEAQREQLAERLHEGQLAVSRANLALDRARDDLTSLAEEIEANLGPIEYPDGLAHQLRLTLGDESVELPRVESIPPGLGEQIRQLRVRLRRLGSVNSEAPAEYEQLLDRQTFLQSQERDLRGAIASLHEIIDELDAVIERDLARTIREVDEAFGRYFERLFGGGSARLVITDPDDLSTTGVDIVARPPGKRAQNLSLLSGGERALAATALLFALLSANPVPFCCLDEVDAALDEANVQRFRALLEEHARHTQFLVITHNRRTIEAAETIYGISMSERGISQSISLRLPPNGNGRGEPNLLEPRKAVDERAKQA